jgi:hypothetical protein
MRHLLLCAALWLCAGPGLAAGSPRPEEAGAPALAHSPAVRAASRELPLQNEAEYTAGINEWLDHNRRQREEGQAQYERVTLGVVSALVVGFLGLLLHTWLSGRPMAFKVSRVLLWAPLFVLAGLWFFPAMILVAMGWAPVLIGIWWRRALSWWELSIASALYLPALVFTWLVFRTLAGMGGG